MKLLQTAIAAILLFAAPAVADEFLDSLDAARDAYGAGDFAAAKEEMDYAGQVLSQMRTQNLGAYLPIPLEGWTMRESDDGGAAAAFGGGVFSGAAYSAGGKSVEVAITVDSPLVATMAMMFGNTAAMAAQGTMKRIGRQKVLVSKQGEIQAIINNRIMITVSGNATIEDKETYFAGIDFRGLRSF
jgi:hypothetical protein